MGNTHCCCVLALHSTRLAAGCAFVSFNPVTGAARHIASVYRSNYFDSGSQPGRFQFADSFELYAVFWIHRDVIQCAIGGENLQSAQSRTLKARVGFQENRWHFRLFVTYAFLELFSNRNVSGFSGGY